METNTNETAGVKPATDEEIRARLLQELNRAYAEVPRFADYSIQVELASYNANNLRWNFSAHNPDACLVSINCDTPQIAALQLGHKYRQHKST